MSRLEKQIDNEFKNHTVTVTLLTNSHYDGKFVECTENGFIGIKTESRSTALSSYTTKYIYFSRENILSIEITK